MSSDFEGYEQDFAVLTAEVTGKIARVPRLPPEEKKQMVANVEKQLEEAKELLEQMDLEVREIPPQSRGMYSNRMRSYKQEMGKLEKDFKRSRIAYSDEVRNELLGDDGNSSENQRAHLLDNTERLERSSRRLEAGYQIAVETEQIGQEMLENLSHDREKIQRARERLRETDANLGKSSRILTGMLRSRDEIPAHHCGPDDFRSQSTGLAWTARRIIQNRILIVSLAIVVVITILMAIIFSVRRP
ncbi:vesicle transport through interaction with t-SNAREs homolog 1A isoform X2 [Dasypus novemcinctus]|uniref:vesicle transport through interaction with t-SNAREs homolog 1A isoform X2 n=1 Tax=Dasypus novemcinctus TaxID=9361 RepID=UPI000329003B|nr:vesicle transport through interaction with t-SNAREs homolog 1A isoform X2 [Dasypus novemcinctus]